MTDCKKALAAFTDDAGRRGEKAGQPLEEEERIMLYCQVPPIAKIDPAILGTLTACPHRLSHAKPLRSSTTCMRTPSITLDKQHRKDGSIVHAELAVS